MDIKNKRNHNKLIRWFKSNGIKYYYELIDDIQFYDFYGLMITHPINYKYWSLDTVAKEFPNQIIIEVHSGELIFEDLLSFMDDNKIILTNSLNDIINDLIEFREGK